MKINPNDFMQTEKVKKELTEGVKVFVALGARHGTFKTGTPFVEVGHVCIDVIDGEAKKEVGCTHYVRFPLIDNTVWLIGNYAYAIGYREEFDPTDLNDIQKVLMSGPVRVKLEDSDYGRQAKKYFAHKCDRDEDGFPTFSKEINDLILKAEGWCTRAFEKAVEREGGTFKTNPNHSLITKKKIDSFDDAPQDFGRNDEIPF